MERAKAIASLPPKEVTDRALRYETTLIRQFDKALNQLERLQRLRMGEMVPPPVNVNVTTEK